MCEQNNSGFYENQRTGTRRRTAAATHTLSSSWDRHMETFLGDTEESTEDAPGRRKSKLKSLKTRLFGKSKKAGETDSRKLSQSASDITAGEGLGSDEDLVCAQGIMGSRALSHDSIFLADQILTESEPTRVLSQENVHSKIKALQDKLQQQKLHFGLPPMVLAMKGSEEQPSRSEEDVHNPSEMTEGHITTQEAINKALSQLSSNPVMPSAKTALNKPVHPTSPNDEAPLDFSTPPQFTPSLDTSAARHRVSVKPRNQRASTKKRLSAVDSTSLISGPDNSETLKEEDGEPAVQEEEKAEDTKLPQTTESTKPVELPKSSQQDIVILGELPTVTSHILRPKPHRSADVSPAVRPHSSFIPSEVKGKSENSGNFDIQFLKDSHNRNWTTDIKSTLSSSDQQSTGPGSVLQPTVVCSETDRTSAIRRPFHGSGSFHLSVSATKKREEERPRSGSFTGVRERAWIKEQPDSSSPNISHKVDIKPSGGPIDVARFKQEPAQDKTWDTKDSVKKVEPVRQFKNKITETDNSEEAAKGVAEEEGKTTFGIKLRSTSQSVRLKAEVTSNEKSAVMEEKLQKQEIPKEMSQKNPLTVEATPDVSTVTSAANVPATSHGTTPLVSVDGQSFPSNPTQSKASPQATSTEVSWMTMAMLKTRSLQSLFTSKFPRDLTGTQTAARSQKVQTTNQAQGDAQAECIKNTAQPLSDAVKTEQSKTQAQTVKQSLPAATAQQQRTPNTFPVKADTSKEAPISKTTEMESQTTSAEPSPQSVTQNTNIWTSQSPLRSVRQVESASQSSSLSSQQPPWSARSLRSTGLASAPSSQDAGADSENSRANKDEGKLVRASSVSKKAAFLERQSEWTSSPVKVKKFETMTASEMPAQTTPQSKDPKASSETKHTESSPRKIPERPREDWLRKTAAPSASPTSSSTLSSSLQSVSDSGQPSWMELAKRKSMAWSDKTMD